MVQSTSRKTPSYLIQEIFDSIQGEGYLTGKPSIFVRFSGCNLSCDFCDTDHTSDRKRIMLPILITKLKDMRTKNPGLTHVVLTGGEPLMQIDEPLMQALKLEQFGVQIETNGSIIPPWLHEWATQVWITCSPKGSFCTETLQVASEFKILVDRTGPRMPTALRLCIRNITRRGYPHLCFQPITEPTKRATKVNVRRAIEWVKANPGSRLSVQLHKLIDVR